MQFNDDSSRVEEIRELLKEAREEVMAAIEYQPARGSATLQLELPFLQT
jgi:hypothetical protein